MGGWGRRVLVVTAIGGVLTLSTGCQSFEEERGRGDAPVEAFDDSAKQVINFPDQFSNVAHACDGHGHRVYVTTQNESGKAMFVVDDPACAGPEGSR